MNTEREIEEVTRRLEQVHLEQGTLLAKLEVLHKRRSEETRRDNRRANETRPSRPPPTRARPIQSNTTDSFQEGQEVIILNPSSDQPEPRGVVVGFHRHRITAYSRVIIRTRDGKEVKRAPKNVAHLEEAYEL